MSNLQRARDIAADASAKQLEGSEHHDPENTKQWLQFMREGAYDSDAIVQAVLRALDEPVDPLLVEARSICADYGIAWHMESLTPAEVEQGKADNLAPVKVVLAALRRGIEIGKEQAS